MLLYFLVKIFGAEKDTSEEDELNLQNVRSNDLKAIYNARHGIID